MEKCEREAQIKQPTSVSCEGLRNLRVTFRLVKLWSTSDGEYPCPLQSVSAMDAESVKM